MGFVANCDCSLIKNKVFDVDTFPYEWFYRLPIIPHKKYEPRSTKRYDYVDAIMTFDIETTRLDVIKQSIIYVWQVCINNFCVLGRTLPELKRFFDKLCIYMDDRTRLFTVVHNLSFEFHHIRDLIKFDNVFSVDKRRPVKAMYKNIEFRCSYILSNMSLDAFLKKMRVDTLKTTMDYSKIRYPWTKLNAKDTQYCLHDVIGLYEAMRRQLDIEGDTLYTIPLTSTGYTRREVKKAYYKISRKPDFQDAIPDFSTFLELHEAFRGGNTHANRWVSGKIISADDYGLIHSWDRVSSYPDVLLKQKYPWKFEKYNGDVLQAMARGKAVLTRAIIRDLKIKDRYDGCPYIPISKCRCLCPDRVEDNGRLLYVNGAFLITLTDIDIKIILSQYDCDIEFYDALISDYRDFPKEIKKVILKYFYGKTQLKGVEGKEDDYMKFKNRFNAIFGLCCQRSAQELIEYSDTEVDLFYYSREKTLEEIYEENKHKLFLMYSAGVWCTAWARKELQDIISIVQNTPDALFLYTDTDSVKFTGNVDFTEYNKLHTELSKKVGAVAKDSKGKIHYIGVLEKEEDMIEFITHGAKKYAYVTEDHKLHLTCAGVNKKKGVEELNTLKWFKDGFIFGESAGLEAKYNDFPLIKFYEIGNRKIKIYSNIYLLDSTYTLTKTVKYKELLDKLRYVGL